MMVINRVSVIPWILHILIHFLKLTNEFPVFDDVVMIGVVRCHD